MKKTLLIIAVILLIAAGVCLILSIFFHWAAGALLDGTAQQYARLIRRQNISLILSAVLMIAGAALLVARQFIKQ